MIKFIQISEFVQHAHLAITLIINFSHIMLPLHQHLIYNHSNLFAPFVRFKIVSNAHKSKLIDMQELLLRNNCLNRKPNYLWTFDDAD